MRCVTAVIHTPDSPVSIEMRKWESQHTEYGPPGRPYVPQEYPKMLYKAGLNAKGKPGILDHLVAADEREQRNLESRGYVAGGPGEAMKAFEAERLEHAKLAAERNYHEARMSPAAQAEAAKADDATSEHVPMVPETPIPPRGRPRQKD